MRIEDAERSVLLAAQETIKTILERDIRSEAEKKEQVPLKYLYHEYVKSDFTNIKIVGTNGFTITMEPETDKARQEFYVVQFNGTEIARQKFHSTNSDMMERAEKYCRRVISNLLTTLHPWVTDERELLVVVAKDLTPFFTISASSALGR